MIEELKALQDETQSLTAKSIEKNDLLANVGKGMKESDEMTKTITGS